MRFLLLSLLFTLFATANMSLYPKKECELFNNLKHTQNRDQQVVQMDKSYEMLKHHKGQYLVKVQGATPPQRWVDDDCFSLRPLRGTPMYEKMNGISPKPTPKAVTLEEKPQKKVTSRPSASKQNLLVLSWHNAFCQTHRYKKECKRSLTSFLRSNPNEKRFVLHGLWPQPRNNVYCDVDQRLIYADKNRRWHELPPLELEEAVKNELERVMPGYASNLHKHEWVKHGSCYGTDVNRYYTDAVSLLQQLNDSEVGKLFQAKIGKTLTIKQVKDAFTRAFGVGAGNHVQMQCKGGMITELWLSLGSGSDNLGTLLQRGKRAFSRCEIGLVDRAGF